MGANAQKMGFWGKRIQPKAKPVISADPFYALAEKLYFKIRSLQEEQDNDEPHSLVKAGYFEKLLKVILKERPDLIRTGNRKLDSQEKLIRFQGNRDVTGVIQALADCLHSAALQAIDEDKARYVLVPGAEKDLHTKKGRSNPDYTPIFLEAIARDVLYCRISHTNVTNSRDIFPKLSYGNSAESDLDLSLQAENGNYTVLPQLGRNTVIPCQQTQIAPLNQQAFSEAQEKDYIQSDRKFLKARKELVSKLKPLSIEEQKNILETLNSKCVLPSSYVDARQSALKHRLHYPDRFAALRNGEEPIQEELPGANNALLNSFCIKLVVSGKDLNLLLAALYPELLSEKPTSQMDEAQEESVALSKQ